MTGLTEHVRVLQPHPGLFAFRDGRIAGQRFRWFAPCAAIHRRNVARTLAAYGHG
jgi:hypothetical protein